MGWFSSLLGGGDEGEAALAEGSSQRSSKDKNNRFVGRQRSRQSSDMLARNQRNNEKMTRKQSFWSVGWSAESPLPVGLGLPQPKQHQFYGIEHRSSRESSDLGLDGNGDRDSFNTRSRMRMSNDQGNENDSFHKRRHRFSEALEAATQSSVMHAQMAKEHLQPRQHRSGDGDRNHYHGSPGGSPSHEFNEPTRLFQGALIDATAAAEADGFYLGGVAAAGGGLGGGGRAPIGRGGGGFPPKNRRLFSIAPGARISMTGLLRRSSARRGSTANAPAPAPAESNAQRQRRLQEEYAALQRWSKDLDADVAARRWSVESETMFDGVSAVDNALGPRPSGTLTKPMPRRKLTAFFRMSARGSILGNL